MPFTDPIVDNTGELVTDDIHSSGYVAGSSGWSINSDGTAEFTDATLRGQLHVGDQVTYGGAIPPEIDASGDPDGWSVTAVIWRLAASPTLEILTLYSDQDGSPVLWEVGINRSSSPSMVTWYSRTAISGGGLPEPFYFRSVGSDLLTTAEVRAIRTTFERGELYIGNAALTHDPNLSPWYVDGVSAARGLAAGGRASSGANSAAVSAEAALLTTPLVLSAGARFFDGRAYEIRWRARLQASVANTSTVRIRRQNAVVASGQLLGDWQFPVGTTGGDCQGRVTVVRAVGAGTLASQITLSLQASTGTTTALGSATSVTDVEVRDIGAAGDYPGAIAIV